jgi:hypothetical protein
MSSYIEFKIFRVTWAHPEFGGILATVAYDRFVNVWYEVSFFLY